MHFSHLHYLPLGLPFFSLLVGLFLVLAVLIQFQVLRYAYTRLGMSSGAALLLLLACLAGSYFNLPVAQLPGQRIVTGQEVDVFGVAYMIPELVDWPGTIVAVNVGGALIPVLVSVYLLARHALWARGLVAVAITALICHGLARPVPGLGIALSPFVPAIAAAIVSLLLGGERAAPLAYVAGSLGVLIGADLMNLGRLKRLGAPIASIGGAGTFDGIFITGVIAVVIAAASRRPRPLQPAGTLRD